MSDDQDQPRRGGDAGTERALDELRVALEQLAARMGAGFREDLAQIRAIAASVAERDLTGDVEALRTDVATLIGRDTSGLADDVAALRAEVARLASGDDVTAGVRSELGPLQAAIDRVSARLDDDSGRTQVLARFERLETRLDEIAGRDGTAEVVTRLDALASRLDSLASSKQVENLPGDLRAHLAGALAGFDDGAVTRELASIRSELGAGHGPLLEQLQDNLADVASGEVVGALWDEVLQLRTDLRNLGDALGSVLPGSDADVRVGALTDELSVLRAELAEGLVVEPSDALSTSLDALKEELDELRTALGDLQAAPEAVAAPADDRRDEELFGQLASIRTSIDDVGTRLDDVADVARPEPFDRAELVAVVADQVSSLRTEIDGLRAALAQVPAPPEPLDDGGDERLLERLAVIQSGIDEVRIRLDDGVHVADAEPAVDASAPDGTGIEALADQVAALRDFVASELDTVRQTMSARLDAATEATAAAVATATTRPEPSSSAEWASPAIDARAIESLRDEIRASGAIGDQVVDALREELKALRRRIAVKAAERVLDEQQLAQIADAVVARLAEGRDPS